MKGKQAVAGVTTLVLGLAACGGTLLLGAPDDAGTGPDATLGTGADAMASGSETQGQGAEAGGATAEGGVPPPEGDAAGPTPDAGGFSADGRAVTPDGTTPDGVTRQRDASPPKFDAALPSLDAALASITPPPAGLAGFAFLVNNVVQQPMHCSAELWEFPPYPASSHAGCQEGSGCPGVYSAVLVNTGTLPMPYLVGELWNVGGGQAQPGVPDLPQGANPIAGVLQPGETVTFTGSYIEDISALVGSAQPFSAADSGVAVEDEGTIFWPTGVAGSGGSTVMHVAEIEVFPACQSVERVW